MAKAMERQDYLCKSALGAYLTSNELHTLSQHTHLIKIAKNRSRNIKQLPSRYFVILQGSIEIRNNVADGEKENFSLMLHKEEFYIPLNLEVYSIDSINITTITAKQKSTLLFFEESDIKNLFAQNSNFQQACLHNHLTYQLAYFLKRHTFFHYASDESLKYLSSHAKLLSTEKDTAIIKQGELGKEVYVIYKGSMDVHQQREDGSTRTLATLQCGEIFGELAAISTIEQTPRNATITANERCLLIILPWQDIDELLVSEQNIGQSMLNLGFKRFRPEAYGHIKIEDQTDNAGEMRYVLTNTKTRQYVQVNEKGYYLFQRMNGEHGLSDLNLMLIQEFKQFSPISLFHLIQELTHANMIKPVSDVEKYHQYSFFENFFRKVKSLLEFNVSIHHVDNTLEHAYQKFAHLFFKKSVLLIGLLIIVLGFIAYAASIPEVAKRIEAGQINFHILYFIYPILILVIPLHELAHAFTTKHFGRKVHRFGIGWYWISPVAFCDTSDIWGAKKQQRMWVSLSGICNDLFLSGFAALLSLAIKNTFVSNILLLYSSFSYLSVIFNLNPILEYDGYLALSDALDTPNLRDKSFLWLKHALKSRDQFKLKEHYHEIFYFAAAIIYIFVSVSLVFLFQEFIIFRLFPDDMLSDYRQYLRFLTPVLIILSALILVYIKTKSRKLF